MVGSDWFTLSLEGVIGTTLTAIGIYLILMLFTRLGGLRSFAKLSSYDFAMTVAMGSILASAVLMQTPSLPRAILAMGVLFLLQALVSYGRRRSVWVKNWVDNRPLVLMAQGNYVLANLKDANLCKADVQEVLRKNGHKSRSQVFAVIMETTGDMSVIEQSETPADAEIFSDLSASDRKLLGLN